MQPSLILIADNDPLVRQCLRRAVEQDAQLRIMWEADNGLQALLMAQQHRPHLILLDAQMPRMDGIEVTRILRQRNHHIRILLMSAFDHQRSSALAAGADAFLTKDSGCDAIRNTIQNLISGTVAY